MQHFNTLPLLRKAARIEGGGHAQAPPADHDGDTSSCCGITLDLYCTDPTRLTRRLAKRVRYNVAGAYSLPMRLVSIRGVFRLIRPSCTTDDGGEADADGHFIVFTVQRLFVPECLRTTTPCDYHCYYRRHGGNGRRRPPASRQHDDQKEEEADASSFAASSLLDAYCFYARYYYYLNQHLRRHYGGDSRLLL